MAAGGPEDPIDPDRVLKEYTESIGMSQPGEMPDFLRKARDEARRAAQEQQQPDNPEGKDTTPKE